MLTTFVAPPWLRRWTGRRGGNALGPPDSLIAFGTQFEYIVGFFEGDRPNGCSSLAPPSSVVRPSRPCSSASHRVPISAAKSATALAPGHGGEKAVAGHGAGEATDPRILARGKATFGEYCANCHGAEGKGEGIAGQNLPIKPQNLTEGRILNAPPDHFLHTLIVHGGQAVGLGPLMPNFTPYLSDVQIGEVLAYVRTPAELPYDPKAVLPVATTRQGPVQPTFFSHVIHAGSYQIACQYCHAGARRSNAAGVPSVERCMACHKIVAAEGNPEVKKIHGYWERQEPIPWRRIFKVPEHAQFTDKQQVQAGPQCQTCHGRIEAMERVYAKTGQHILNDLQNLALMPRRRAAYDGLARGVRPHRQRQGRAGRADRGRRADPVGPGPQGSESERRNAPLERVTCHH